MSENQVPPADSVLKVGSSAIGRRGMLGALTGAAAIAAISASAPAAAEPSRMPANNPVATLEWIDVRDHGVVGDGSTDDSTALLSLLGDGGDSADVYFPAGRYRLSSDVTVHSGVTVHLDAGAQLLPDAGVTLRLDGIVAGSSTRIFGGDGTVEGTFGGLEVIPQWFGAHADGEGDDAPAIRAAVDALYHCGGGTVFLPAGTYLLRDTVGDPTTGGNHPFIIPRSRVDIRGTGDNTILKAADGLNSTLTPGFNVIFPLNKTEDYRVDDATFANFKVDCNGINNLQIEVPKGSPMAKNAAIGVQRGSNITVDNITVVNNAGRQCFTFGANEKPQTVENLRITNCRVHAFAQGIPGNVHQNDHSVVYAQAIGCLITGNIVTQPPGGDADEPTDGGTAFEIHSQRAVVSDNLVAFVNNAINLAATVTDLRGVVVHNNVCQNVCKALHVWVRGDNEFDDVIVESNVFHQSGLGAMDNYPYDFGLLDASASVVTPASRIQILNNEFTYAVAAAPNRGRPCIAVGAVHDVMIRGNWIQGFPGSAIQWQDKRADPPTLDRPSTILIADNTIQDCGNNPEPARRIGINIATGSDYGQITIVRNRVRMVNDQGAEIGIQVSVPIPQLRVQQNEIDGVAQPFSWNPPEDDAFILLEHIGSGGPTGGDDLPASVGSTWIDPVAGTVWRKTSGATSAWRALRY